MSKRQENLKKIEEIHKRLDEKAKILYVAYRNNRLDLDILNEDMKNRILTLEQEESKQTNEKSKLNENKITNINNGLKNIIDILCEEEEENEEDSEPESDKLIIKFNDFNNSNG